ncbi:class I SAM-dependent methyltransferase [Priestia flexa]|uniref:Class I SAM-dependent methyltransferase n=1 Tax=Priestia flexa TaxID=86664 RepID=A0ABU4JBL9_9BACI|nr:class I SAM-dependent methyltransferase [Priestia flexa]AQX53680.1 methyltransferase [Priestia flexa]MBY6085197.1 class I SAM-dependent methyltransferase [Priestia flexa]MCA1200718.1 class I SAM-dependent methyltransferase [Priestia flexa]MCG7311797.1 class I SAM-dependent methyltransferase [Priestia flexa]MCP1190677.1 class I SAM-dependent methyltransferase [Priestia flexa]
MSSYKQFAYVYDHLMTDIPYDQWIQFVSRKVKPGEKLSILDVGCGTGEMSIRLAKQGYEVTGIDLSDDMLVIAQEKAQNEGIALKLYEQDMSKLELMQEFDCIVIFCDSLNYLQTDEQVKETFMRVYEHLAPGGFLLFDVHSTHKLKNIFGDNSFSYVDDDVSYIWNCEYNEANQSVQHDMTFFVYDEEIEAYDRFDEVHIQRTLSESTYKEWLTEAGFSAVEVSADFKDEFPHQSSERIFFSAKK